MTPIRKLVICWRVAKQAWKQAPDAIKDIRKSESSGEGFNNYDFPNGFIDFYDVLDRKDIDEIELQG